MQVGKILTEFYSMLDEPDAKATEYVAVHAKPWPSWSPTPSEDELAAMAHYQDVIANMTAEEIDEMAAASYTQAPRLVAKAYARQQNAKN